MSDSAAHIVAVWLVAHVAKPIIAALSAVTAAVVGGVSVAVAWLAQIDLSTFDFADAAIPATGTGIIIFAVRFLVNVYREALTVARTNLDSEREDRAEDRQAHARQLAALRERNAELERQLLNLMSEKAHLEAHLSERPGDKPDPP